MSLCRIHRPSRELRANSGTGATPMVPPGLQPWTKQKERASMVRARQAVHMGCELYIHFHLRCWLLT
jgi:hypothetical protein